MRRIKGKVQIYWKESCRFRTKPRLRVRDEFHDRGREIDVDLWFPRFVLVPILGWVFARINNNVWRADVLGTNDTSAFERVLFSL